MESFIIEKEHATLANILEVYGWDKDTEIRILITDGEVSEIYLNPDEVISLYNFLDAQLTALNKL